MILNDQTVGGLTVYCIDASTTWQIAGWHSLSFKTIVDDIEWWNSRRVDCVLSRRIHHMIPYCRLAKFIFRGGGLTLKCLIPSHCIIIFMCLGMTLCTNGPIVGGLTVYCLDAFTTWYHIAGSHSFINQTTVDDNEGSNSARVNIDQVFLFLYVSRNDSMYGMNSPSDVMLNGSRSTPQTERTIEAASGKATAENKGNLSFLIIWQADHPYSQLRAELQLQRRHARAPLAASHINPLWPPSIARAQKCLILFLV